jgi:hypothetical protein
VRLLDRILIGRRTRDVNSMFAKAKYIRKVGVVLAVLLVGGFLAAAHFLQGTVVKGYAVTALTQANKAEADIDTLGISVLGGNVAVSGLQLTDPKNPQQNQLSIEKMEADANITSCCWQARDREGGATAVRFNPVSQTPGKVEQVVKEKPSTNAKVSGRLGLEKYARTPRSLEQLRSSATGCRRASLRTPTSRR